MPPASILSEESVTAAGDAFGKDPEKTVGTGPFILDSWEPGKSMTLRANPDCWQGAPDADGIELYYVTDEVEQRLMFERGELDILDLAKLGDEAEYFIHGDIYRDRLHTAPQVDISYIALNQAAEPLSDVRVRLALQMSLDRQMILDALYAGRGTVEDGIFPHALKGFNPELEPIAYDPAGAVTLLAEAGYPEGFKMEVQVNASAGRAVRDLMNIAASMWKKIGVKVTVNVLPESEFMELRTTGAATCYTATWSADFNDPDNFIYTFFGSEDNTRYRSLNYADKDVIKRVQGARAILDEEERLKEYAALEQKIIREDASWIPLFSRTHIYVTGERVDHYETAWNGASQPTLRKVTLK
jgi:ABC-type transport system substrate-binding protein